MGRLTTRKPGVPAIFVNTYTQRSYPAAGVMGVMVMQDTRWNGFAVAEIRQGELDAAVGSQVGDGGLASAYASSKLPDRHCDKYRRPGRSDCRLNSHRAARKDRRTDARLAARQPAPLLLQTRRGR